MREGQTKLGLSVAKAHSLVQGQSLGFMTLLTTVLGACTDSRVLGQHLPKKHCLPAVSGLPVIAPPLR